MKCNKCGTELPEDALFCAACGASVRDRSLNSVWAQVLTEDNNPAAENPDCLPENPAQERQSRFLTKHQDAFSVWSVLPLLPAIIVAAVFAVIGFQTRFFGFALAELIALLLLGLLVAIPRTRIPGCCVHMLYLGYCLFIATDAYQLLLGGSLTTVLNTWASRNVSATVAGLAEIGIYLIVLVLFLLLCIHSTKPGGILLAAVSSVNVLFQLFAFAVFLFRIIRYALQYSLPVFSVVISYFFFWHGLILILVSISSVFFALSRCNRSTPGTSVEQEPFADVVKVVYEEKN